MGESRSIIGNRASVPCIISLDGFVSDDAFQIGHMKEVSGSGIPDAWIVHMDGNLVAALIALPGFDGSELLRDAPTLRIAFIALDASP